MITHVQRTAALTDETPRRSELGDPALRDGPGTPNGPSPQRPAGSVLPLESHQPRGAGPQPERRDDRDDDMSDVRVIPRTSLPTAHPAPEAWLRRR